MAADKVLWVADERFNGTFKQIPSNHHLCTVPSGEECKTLSQAERIASCLLNHQMSKNDWCIAVGGGSVTDLCGFVASIYKRGMRLAVCPTTLLSLIDASLGGKNAINLGQLKNQLGTVYQPDLLFCCTSFLAQLPASRWSAGFAEIIKHALIADEAMFRSLEANTLSTYQLDEAKLLSLIQQNMDLKMQIVANDPLDTGLRMLLNAGHTIGHAIEAAFAQSHGEAVAIGLVVEAFIAGKINGFSAANQERIQSLLQQYELPIQCPEFEPEILMQKIIQDKKRSGDYIHMPVITAIGQATVMPVPVKQLAEWLNEWVCR
jgi:3-dehydroquinate synthase